MRPPIKIVRLFIAGLVAGAIIVGLNVPMQLVLGERVQRETNAWLPGAADRMHVDGTAVAVGIAMKLAIGIILVWLSVAARPRLGSGPETATLIALTAWLLGAIFFSDFPLTGMISWTTYALLEALQLLAFLVAAWAGVRLYREP